MYTNDFLFPKLFLNQGRGSRLCFQTIVKDHKHNKGGAIIVNSDQGASKTVFAGAVLMYALMQKEAHINGVVSSHMFDKVVFLSFSDNAKGQVESDFDKYLYPVGGELLPKHDDFTFFSVNKQDLKVLLKNLRGNILMVIDEPQKAFTESDSKRRSHKRSPLYEIVTSTPNIYKIFLTATPMNNSIMEMVNYVGPFLRKHIDDVVVEDILDPNTYKNRVFFISSSVVDFKNTNLIFSREEIKDYVKIVDNFDNNFTLYKVEDESNMFLNTSKMEISDTQLQATETRIRKGLFGVGGISMEFLKLSVVSGKEYEQINGHGYSDTFDKSELFEISPKMHYIYERMKMEKQQIKAIVKVEIYSEIFTKSKSSDGDVYLFDYFNKYPGHFEEFTYKTGELDPKKLYYLNGFDKRDSSVKRNIEVYNRLGEYPGASVLCFIPERYSTGFTYVRVRWIFLWDYGFHYTGNSQTFGRISRTGQMPKGRQEAIILEQDINVSSMGSIAKYKDILIGDLTNLEYEKFKKNVLDYYSTLLDKSLDKDTVELSVEEIDFRKRFRALYSSFTRKNITHNKLKSISQVENIMNSQNVLADYIDESKPSQLFPLRDFIKCGKYHTKKIPIIEKMGQDVFDGDGQYNNIFMNHVDNMFTQSSQHKPFGLSGDLESDSVIINVEPLGDFVVTNKIH